MDTQSAIEAFASLAQPTRLTAFRQLIKVYPDELPAGDIARFCKAPHNTMSSHLAILTRAGLIAVRRDGRVMNYRADVDGFRKLVKFMMQDCCNGRPEICAPLIADLACCTPQRAKEKARVGSRL